MENYLINNKYYKINDNDNVFNNNNNNNKYQNINDNQKSIIIINI
jgi:hypothetical protein